ncbi:hypothetical protein ACUL41_04380 [Virgibacillus natechei]
MKNKRKLNKAVFLSLIFILVCGISPSITGTDSVYADEDADESGNSGGFVIETDKVEGTMDPTEALEGLIDIGEGVIEGLTITKTLDMGEDQDSLIIKITSPGPIPVKDMYAETVEGTTPTIGGLCVSDTPGYLCLENVTMTVTGQEVDDISLPEAKIETCYESECDFSGGEDPSNQAAVNSMLQKMEGQELTLREIQEGLAEDEKKLQELKELLEQATVKYEEIETYDQLESLIPNVREILSEEIDTINEGNPADTSEESENEEAIEDEEVENAEEEGNAVEAEEDEEANESENAEEDEKPVENNLDELNDLTKDIGETYDSINETTDEFTKILDEAFELIQELEENISVKEEALAAFNEEVTEESSDEQQAETYASLIDESKEEGKGETNEGEIDLSTLQETLDKSKSEIVSFKENAEELREKRNTILEEMEIVTDDIIDLKGMIKELDMEDADYPEGFVKALLENLKSIETNGHTEDESEGDEAKEETDDTTDDNTAEDSEDEADSKEGETEGEDNESRDVNDDSQKGEDKETGDADADSQKNEDKETGDANDNSDSGDKEKSDEENDDADKNGINESDEKSSENKSDDTSKDDTS